MAARHNTSKAETSLDKYIPIEDRKSGWSDYELREALSTLSHANKIRKNVPLMRAVRAEAQRQLKAAAATATSLKR